MIIYIYYQVLLFLKNIPIYKWLPNNFKL
jgi:hypothetical protein